KPDGSWDGNGIRLRLENNVAKLSRFNNFVETTMRSQLFLIPPLPSDDWVLVAGYEGDARRFKVMRNGVTMMSHKENGTASLMGPAYRGVGFGFQAGAALPTQATPGFLRRVWAGDNSTVSQEGFLERVNIGDQPMYDDYTLFGPGKFKIYDGPDSTEFVEFGPLLDNQIVFLRTDPRVNTTLVQDLTVVPPSPQALTGFQQAVKRLVSFFSGRSALTDAIFNNFGIRVPQGNLYKYLDGRFSDNAAIPPKSPGNRARPYYVKVAIDDGNADSKIIASGT
ncbi:Gp23 protein, partial [Mycolicibacterium canariasense]